MRERYQIQLSRRVESQLEKIFEYIAQDSPDNASGLIAEVLNSIYSLQVFPKRQRVQSSAGALVPVRSLPCGNYMIFFEIDEPKQVVKIIRVSHGSRKRPKRYT